jgi:two-component system response regulator RpfG
MYHSHYPEYYIDPGELLMPFELIESNVADIVAPVVVIIDDEFTSRAILDKVVRNVQKNIIVQTFSDPVPAMEWVRSNQPDLIMLDYMMGSMTGLEVVKQMRRIASLEGVPIVVVTSLEEREVRYQVLDAGATDFITKPIDPYECRVRCRNMLALRMQQKIILSRSQFLEYRVADATRLVRQREQETLFRLAKAGEYRDQDTGDHILRMARYSRLIAEAMGLSQDRCDLIEAAAPMHDIGKIGMPDNVLLKPGKLTVDEFDLMKAHPLVGYQILQNSPSKYLSMAADIALGHHEKFDGSGYPYGLKGEQIPLEARIVSVADVYDALTSNRPYKKGWTSDESLAYLISQKGIHFDPECVDAFVAQFGKVSFVQHQLPGIADPQPM